MRPWVVAVSILVGALAGCTEGSDDTSDPGALQFGAGTGAISGLLVDDRYRPIELTDDPETEFQREGFVLLQETGQRTQSNENGEFGFSDLDPGRYTLRVTADGHEAIPQVVQVEEGMFNEAVVAARRLANVNERFEVTEFNFFIPCSAYATFDCTFDQSGDSSRNVFELNFSEQYDGGLSYVHFEAKMNQPGMYCLEVRRGPGAGGAGDDDAKSFADWCIGPDEDYISGILEVEGNYMGDGKADYEPQYPHDVLIFYFGNNEATCFTEIYHYYNPDAGQRCLGAAAGVKAKVFASLFFGDPEVDLDSYCIQCD